MPRPYSASLPPQPPQQNKPQSHHPIRLILHQPIRHLHRHRRRPAADQRRNYNGAVPLVKERRQHHLGRDGLVSVGHKGGEPVIVNGHALVGVSCDKGELHGDGDERGRRGVDLVDGRADDLELRLVGAVD